MRDSARVSFRGLAVTALLCSSLLAEAAYAQEASRGNPSDAATYAAAMGVPLGEAQRRLALQLRLGEVEAKLSASAGDVFAGLFIEHQPRFAVRALFTDVARGQELLRPLAAGAGQTIEIGYAAVSLRELEALQERSLAELRAAGIAVDADIDLRGNRVVIDTTAPAEVARRLAAVSSLAGDRLAVVPVAELAQPEQLTPMRGGRPLDTCSAGFTARNAAGSVGMLSAGHCPDFQIYWDEVEVLPFLSRQYSGSRDVGFYHRACSLSAPNEFDSGIGIRQVTGTRTRDQQVVGSLVCRFGMTTAYRCGTISSKSVCPSYVSSCSSTFMRVQPTDGLPLSGPGDSGGPWFVETLAHGIHSGGYTTNNDSIYMAINYASTTANVLTTNSGIGFPTAKLTCSGNYVGSALVQCTASATGGRPPYTYNTWFYNGAADYWSVPFSNKIQASYPFGGCGAGDPNYFSVMATDACGVMDATYTEAPCPENCIYGLGAGTSDGDQIILPPFCPAI